MTTFADDLIAAFEPWTTADLQEYLEALAVPFDQVQLLAFDTDDPEVYDGWTLIMDPNRAPAYALPWLAQFVGERLPPGLETSDEAAARQRVIDHPNQRRGTVESIRSVAQRHLTGSKQVAIYERTPDEDTVTIQTLTAETGGNATLIFNELRAEAVPADIVLVYGPVTGLTYLGLELDPRASDYLEAENEPAWPTYADIGFV